MSKRRIFGRTAIERLKKLLLSVKSLEPHLTEREPNWIAWVSKLGLNSEVADELVTQLKHLWLLPFADVPAVAEILVFKHTEIDRLRERFRQTKDLEGERLCALYDLLVRMSLEGFSVIPQNPAHLAQQTAQVLRFPRERRTHLRPLLDLLVDEATCEPLTGFNTAEVANPETIIECEHERREGLMERAWKADFKYHDFAQSVRDQPEFQRDWSRLKTRFKLAQFADADGVIRRSGLREGSWRQPVFSDLSREESRFRVAFDFFAWKWFLYGMRGDEPLVQKLAYTLTPFGTQIFIPGYWSFDPKRDLNWKKILRLHRARGVARQGEKINLSRAQRLEQGQRLLSGEAEARRSGLRGEARYALLKRRAGLNDRTDDAQVRRMLREARNSSAR